MTAHPLALLEERALNEPQSILLDAMDQTMSNAECLEMVRQTAWKFRGLGVLEGDVVALNLPGPLHVVFALAAWHEGATCCSFAPWLAESTNLRPDWLFSTFDYPATSALRVVKIDERFFSTFTTPSADVQPRPVGGDSVARLVFSSGTTGTPKAVPLTFNIIRERTRQRLALHPPATVRFGLQDLGAVDGFIRFSMALEANQPYLIPGPPAHNLAQIEKHRPQVVGGSPAQFVALLEFLEVAGPGLGIQEFTVIGSQLPVATAERLRRATGAIITTAYGSTEAGRIAGRRADSNDAFDVGQLDPNARVEIVDDDDRVLANGVVGRLRCQQVGQVAGYFRDPEATAMNFKDGWFYPGDLAMVTERGTLELAGRSSEVLNLGGVKVDPARVDAVAASQPGVTDAAAFITRDDVGREALMLAVVSTEHVDSQQLLGVLKAHFGRATPLGVVERQQIPRNANGKIDRRLLSQEFDGRSHLRGLDGDLS